MWGKREKEKKTGICEILKKQSFLVSVLCILQNGTVPPNGCKTTLLSDKKNLTLKDKGDVTKR